MSTAAATAVAFAVAAVLSFFVPRRLRWVLVVAVCVVPIALAAPQFVRAERSDAAASARASVYSRPPPFKWRKSNPALLAGIVDHVPAHESVSIVNATLETGWIRWLAYSIAPRQLTRGRDELDDRLRRDAGAGRPPPHARVDSTANDWLVER